MEPRQARVSIQAFHYCTTSDWPLKVRDQENLSPRLQGHRANTSTSKALRCALCFAQGCAHTCQCGHGVGPREVPVALEFEPLHQGWIILPAPASAGAPSQESPLIHSSFSFLQADVLRGRARCKYNTQAEHHTPGPCLGYLLL